MGLLGLLMMLLGPVLMTISPMGSPIGPSAISLCGLALLFVGTLLVIGAVAYALTKPVVDAPDTPGKPYPINDPDRA